MILEWYKDYDNLVEKIAPDYKKTLQAITYNIPSNTQRIMELACGTGNLTLKLATRLPNTFIDSVDSNPEMLCKAREKLSGATNVMFHEKDILNISFSPTQIIASSYFFHLLPKKERYKLFDRIIKQGVPSIYIADRLSHKDDFMFYDNFVYRFRIEKGIPIDIINKITKENEKNQLERIEDQINYFNRNGYDVRIYNQSSKHGFMAYSYIKRFS